MKKKTRPSEIITDLKKLKEVNYMREEDKFQRSSKKSHKKNKSINDKYYLLDIYKNKSFTNQSNSPLPILRPKGPKPFKNQTENRFSGLKFRLEEPASIKSAV